MDNFYRHGAGLDGKRSLSVGVTVLAAAVVAVVPLGAFFTAWDDHDAAVTSWAT